MSRFASLFIANSSDRPQDPPAESRASAPYRILFVDDEPNVLRAMRRIFRRENYTLWTAPTGEDAVDLLKTEGAAHVVISDFRMPGMDGAALLRHVKETYPETIRIMLTGHADVNAIMGAVNDGAVYKFITKPWNDEDLRLTVGLALEQYDLRQENRELKIQADAQKKKIRKLSRFASIQRSQVGRLLVRQRLLDEAQLEKAVALQQKNDALLGDLLIRLGFVDETTIMKTITATLGIQRVNPEEFSVPRELAALVPREICEKSALLPLKRAGQHLIVVMADPTDFTKIDDLKFITGMPVTTVLAAKQQILDKIGEVFGSEDALEAAMSAVDLGDPTEQIEIVLDEDDEVADVKELLAATDKPPAIRIVNAIISDALRHGASDIHIEPKTKHVLVRYRIDDLLQEKLNFPLNLHLAVVSRIKIMGELDIAERRRPQDGRITVKTSSRIVDMRISTLPTINGEKVVLRVLDKNAAIKGIEELGMSARDLHLTGRFIEQPQGIVLATGPTGSGKTSTLYSLLRYGAKITKNFTTIEDPVEYQMNMAEQVNIRDKIGLNFSQVLRSVLRQDPNVIMLGEIRDKETAEVAFHAALTGHLVLSTLHTNNAIASITRLRDIGLNAYVIADALLGIITQRLVRRICSHCAADVPVDVELVRALKLEQYGFQTRRGSGCDRCNHTGYKGRIGIFEVLYVDREIKKLIHRDASETELSRLARLAGMKTLIEDAAEKIRDGMTTCEEVIRVLGPKDTVVFPCGGCGARLEERFRYCPFCGHTNMRQCEGCGRVIEGPWRVCPDCGKSIPLPPSESPPVESSGNSR